MTEKLKEEYIFSEKPTRQEVRFFNYSIAGSKFVFPLLICGLIITGISLIYFSVIMLVDNITELRFIIIPQFFVFIMLLNLVIGQKLLHADYAFKENSFKVSFNNTSREIIKEYNKNDVKKIFCNDNFIGINIGWRGNYIIPNRYFKDKTEFNDFSIFLQENYKDKIIRK